MGTTFDGAGFDAHLEKAQESNPDVVVITGDLVDDNTSREDMVAAAEALGRMDSTYGIYFVYGNHDKGYFDSRDYTAEEFAATLESNGIIILEDETVSLGDHVLLIGRQDKSDRSGRASMKQLTQDIDTSKYLVVLDHQPNDYSAEEAVGIDLVLSGHTHGGQMIPIGPFSELIGMNDATYGLQRRGHTDFIVNSGIGDWEIAFKTGTFSEYVVVDIRS